MRYLFAIAVAVLVMATASLASAELYKWVDGKGTVHFTEDPSTIPEKYRNQTTTRKTEEDYMTVEERIKAQKEQERRARENNQKNQLKIQREYEKSLKEEKIRKANREKEDALNEKKLNEEKERRKVEEAIKKAKEEEESYKKCWNCDGKGYLGMKVVQSHGGVPRGPSFHVDKTCSICSGTGKLKK